MNRLVADHRRKTGIDQELAADKRRKCGIVWDREQKPYGRDTDLPVSQLDLVGQDITSLFIQFIGPLIQDLEIGSIVFVSGLVRQILAQGLLQNGRTVPFGSHEPVELLEKILR
jgi:hypothetical protein